VIARRALLATMAPPGLARAQTRMLRVGSLHLAPWTAPHHVAFRAALARAGLVEGQTLDLDPAGHGLRREQFEAHAEARVREGIQLFHVSGDPAIRAALAASRSVAVLALTDDMVRSGLAASYAQPGGMITGVSILGAQLDRKRLELLLALVPEARRILALGDALLTGPAQVEAQREAAAQRGVALSVTLVRRPEEIAPALEAAKAAGAEAVNVLATPLLFNNRQILFERMAALRLPAIYQWPDMAREGGLAAYGPNIVQLYREQMAPMAARLLRGAPPASLPIEQPTRFELVLNLRTARSLGLAPPPPLLAQAEEVIE